MAKQVKNLLAIQETQETQVQSLVRKDPLEEEMATHSSILAWEIPWTKEPARLQFMGFQESDTTYPYHWTHWSSHLTLLKDNSNS